MYPYPSDAQDGAIKLLEFASESEYWAFVQKFNRCREITSVENSNHNPTNNYNNSNNGGSCVFSSNGGNTANPHLSSGGPHQWAVEGGDLLKITDNRGTSLFTIIVIVIVIIFIIIIIIIMTITTTTTIISLSLSSLLLPSSSSSSSSLSSSPLIFPLVLNL